jgi:hypothetical protein
MDSGTDEEAALMSVCWPNCAIPHPEVQGKTKAFIAGGIASDPREDTNEMHARVKAFIWDKIGVEPLDLSHPAPFNSWNKGFDFFFPVGTDHACWKGSYVTRLSEELAQDVMDVVNVGNRRIPMTLG